MKVYLEPQFRGEDKGDGGIRRVVEAQRRYLPEHGVEFVDNVRQAEVVAVHITPQEETKRWLEAHPEVPYVAHLHGAYWAEYDWLPWAHRANELLIEAVRQADLVTAPSEWIAQSFRRNSLRRVEVVGHGVDLAEWPARQEAGDGGYVLWNKTRLDAVCDPDPMIRLAQMAPNVPFVTTFWPSKRPADNVTSTGRLGYEDARARLQRAAVYLCTTRETFGIGTLEAMACGVPILAWNWGGQKEFLEHKATGWLGKVGDYDNLLEGLDYCLGHRAEIGKACRRVVEERFQWKDVIGRYAELYERILRQAQEERPKVSVVVPAYNLEQYLPETLDSVLEQTSGDWECVVVDDASPDGCGQIAEQYASRDPRFKVVHNAENQYLAGALNTGIAASRGRYVVPLDADNLLMPDTLKLLAGELDKDRSMHIAYGNVLFVGEGGQPDDRVGPGGHSGWPMAFRADWQLMTRNMVPSTCMYRRDVWELTGGYRRRWRTAEDADFWTRATSYGFRARMVTEADTLVYRNRGESMSRQEVKPDWTAWFPWCAKEAVAPAAILTEPQVGIPSLEPEVISVVIPVGPGHEELLIDALDSVDGQTLRLWECIVVNDTGRPLRWLPSWARLVETTGRRGVAAARNLGIAVAKGRLFLPLDADDTLEPEALSRLFVAEEKYGGYIYPDWFERRGTGESVWETSDFKAQDLIDKGCIHAVTALYPVEAWRRVGGFDEQLPAWEDWDFMLKLADVAVCGTRYPLPLFTYRKDTGMRREENYAEFEASKAAILEKWGPYFQGRRELMGCRACPGGRRAQVNGRQEQTQEVPAPIAPTDGQYVLFEYIGDKQGGMQYRGPATGQRYRFAGTQTERVKLVHVDDAPLFASLPDFRQRQPEAPAEVG